MSRRCSCARLLAAIQSDPRLRTLPLAARMLFMLLGEAMLAAGTPGELPFSGTQRVSLLVSAPETEVETQIETLIGEGLLQRDGDRLLAPLLAAPPQRTRSAQENGRLGGRPRRGETAAEARDRRSQGHLVLPITGGAETQETQAAKPASMIIRESSISSSVSEPRAKPEAMEGILALAEELAALAGMDPAKATWSAREVQGWLAAGASPALCREVVADVMSRAKQVPGTLAYFTRALHAALARAGAAPQREVRNTAMGRWAAALEDHVAKGGDPAAFARFEQWSAAA
jgi:hypothetical protein